MEKDRYLSYIPPDKPHVEWTDRQLFDEVDWIATHRINIRPIGERALQLTMRMKQSTGEQEIRYNERKANEVNQAWSEKDG